MIYKIIVDKQSRINPSLEKKEYEVDIEELRVKGNIHDSLIFKLEGTYIMRRLELSDLHVLSVLQEPIKELIKTVKIELFSGNNYIYLIETEGNRFYAEYLVKNEFNEMFATRKEMNSTINQTIQEIDLAVNQKFTNYSTTEEMNASINIKAEEIAQEVKKKVNEEEFGTKLSQNSEAVKLAWNKISEFIQMELIKQNPSLVFRNDIKKILTAIDKLGYHFYKSNGTEVLGDIGISTDIDSCQYLSFSTLMNYGEELDSGMAWGIKTKNDNKFHPVLYMKNYDMPLNGTPYGQLVLANCDLIVGGNYELGTGGSIVIGNLTMTGNMQKGMSFVDNNGNYLFSIYKGDGTALAPYDTIKILDNISFFRNAGGTNSFRIGTEEKCCVLSDEGILTADYAILGNSNRGIAIFGTSNLYDGNFSVTNGNIYANNFASDRRLKKDIKNVEVKALDKIKQIVHKQFCMKTDEKHYDIGYIAQELEKIDNNFVLKRKTTKEEKNKGYQYYINELPLIATITKAIQEQQEQIENQNNIIQNSIKRIEKLEAES